MHQIYTKLVGVTFANEDGSSRQEIISALSAGDKLHLVDLASEKYPEAIGVLNSQKQHCGNLSKDLALSLRKDYENFETLSVCVKEVTGGDGLSYGCNIEISVPEKKKRKKKSTSEKEESQKIITKLVRTTGKDMYGEPIQENLAGLSVGDTLKLYDDTEPGESVSIAVCDHGAECGYLPKSVASRLMNLEGSDIEDFSVTVIEIDEDESGKYHCTVEIDTDTDYTCQIFVGNDDSLRIKTPLINVPSSIFPALRVGEDLQVKDTLGQEFVAVYRQDQSFVGNLPEFATEHMRKRRLNLTDTKISILLLRMDDDEPYCKVKVQTGAPTAEPSSGSAPEDPPHTQIKEQPQISDNTPTMHVSAEADSKENIPLPVSEKNTNTKKEKKGGCLTFVLVLFFIFWVLDKVF